MFELYMLILFCIMCMSLLLEMLALMMGEYDWMGLWAFVLVCSLMLMPISLAIYSYNYGAPDWAQSHYQVTIVGEQ